MPNADTPLSNVMDDCQRLRDAESIERLIEEFARSSVGVIAEGVPEDAEGRVTSDGKNLRLGDTDHGDGRTRILVFADPEVFARQFGRPFNAEMLGTDVYRTVVANPNCDGVLVNSATSEMSMVIDRDAAELFLTGEAPRRKPWWKFW